MKRTRKWHKKLTIRELRHLEDSMEGVPTLGGLIRNREFHLSQVAAGLQDPCHQCKMIAQKLGLE